MGGGGRGGGEGDEAGRRWGEGREGGGEWKEWNIEQGTIA